MSKANEPAFPLMSVEHGPILGLTKRELIAAMCLQGLVANSDGVALAEDGSRRTIYGHAAFDAVKLADALLAELEKQS